MGRKIGNYISNKKASGFSDIDFHDFIDMVYSGLSNEEIAGELGVNRNYIEKLRNEFEKDY